jgi:subtilisin family serine protease
VTEDMLQGKLETADRNYYWEVAAGTSMSCPFVAGSIALWLEANPTLTFDDVLNIIEKTSIKDSYVTDANSGVDPIQWGAGKFDAYEGLKEALRMNSVNDIAADKDSRLMLTNNGSLYNVFVAGEQSLKVDIFSMTGQRVYTSTTIGDEASFDTSSLTKGVYVVSVNGVHNQKIAIK